MVNFTAYFSIPPSRNVVITFLFDSATFQLVILSTDICRKDNNNLTAKYFALLRLSQLSPTQLCTFLLIIVSIEGYFGVKISR